MVPAQVLPHEAEKALHLNALCHFGPCHASKQKVWHILQAWHIAWSMCDPVVCAHLPCGIYPGTSGRMDCDVIDVNSAPDESAREGSYVHVHGSHL